jgi:hypothetical protein
LEEPSLATTLQGVYFIFSPLHVSALVGHLQAEYTIILGSYFTTDPRDLTIQNNGSFVSAQLHGVSYFMAATVKNSVSHRRNVAKERKEGQTFPAEDSPPRAPKCPPKILSVIFMETEL